MSSLRKQGSKNVTSSVDSRFRGNDRFYKGLRNRLVGLLMTVIMGESQL